MGSKVSAIVIDANDVDRIGAFWAAVLGWEPQLDSDGDIVLADPNHEAGFELLVLRVPEGKAVKDRLHIDLAWSGASQAEELERLIGLGAVRVDIGQGDRSWVVLADPEGNEFCLLDRRAD
jgi:catechol 2,3-dioxygenase-like lactoylglutathione lyase family enzyme